MISPFYKVVLANSKRDVTDLVTKVILEDSTEEDNYCRITVRADVNTLDTNLFLTGKLLYVTIGYNSGEESTQILRIVDVETDYNGSTSNQNLKCLDMGHLAHKNSSQKVWYGKTTLEIAKDIADKRGLDIYTDGTLSMKWDRIPQANRTDMELLQWLVSRETKGGCICYVRNSTIYLVSKGYAKETSRSYTWNYGEGTVMSFKTTNYESKKNGENSSVTTTIPTAKSERAANSKSASTDYEVITGLSSKDLGFVYRTEVNDSTESSVGDTGERKIVFDEHGAFKGYARDSKPVKDTTDNTKRTNVRVDAGKDTTLSDNLKRMLFANPEMKQFVSVSSDSQEETTNTLNNIKGKHFGLEAVLKVMLDPKLQCDITIQMHNVAKAHSGVWYVYKVVHTISAGAAATTELYLRKNAGKVGGQDAKKPNGDSKATSATQGILMRVYDINKNEKGKANIRNGN